MSSKNYLELLSNEELAEQFTKIMSKDPANISMHLTQCSLCESWTSLYYDLEHHKIMFDGSCDCSSNFSPLEYDLVDQFKKYSWVRDKVIDFILKHSDGK